MSPTLAAAPWKGVCGGTGIKQTSRNALELWLFQFSFMMLLPLFCELRVKQNSRESSVVSQEALGLAAAPIEASKKAATEWGNAEHFWELHKCTRSALQSY